MNLIAFRDINSKNILIASDMTAKIADFGAAVSPSLIHLFSRPSSHLAPPLPLLPDRSFNSLQTPCTSPVPVPSVLLSFGPCRALLSPFARAVLPFHKSDEEALLKVPTLPWQRILPPGSDILPTTTILGRCPNPPARPRHPAPKRSRPLNRLTRVQLPLP